MPSFLDFWGKKIQTENTKLFENINYKKIIRKRILKRAVLSLMLLDD
jgi:hypothetical protein